MTSGYGNTRKQAERNASINGYKWLIDNILVGNGNNNSDTENNINMDVINSYASTSGVL